MNIFSKDKKITSIIQGGKRKKLKQTTKAEIKGFITGILLGGLSVCCIFFRTMYNQVLSQKNNLTNIQQGINTDNLLHKEGINEDLLINAISEVTISDVKKDTKSNSNLVYSTITIANNKSNNTLISNTISRTEVREDGNLIKIIDINEDDDFIIKPNSIESFKIDFPISTDAKKLKIEVYSPLVSKPISSKTFDLSTK